MSDAVTPDYLNDLAGRADATATYTLLAEMGIALRAAADQLAQSDAMLKAATDMGRDYWKRVEQAEAKLDAVKAWRDKNYALMLNTSYDTDKALRALDAILADKQGDER